ncbi:hypothetical protein U1Q18_051900 [Sarracenia purpurea var. burkii]
MHAEAVMQVEVQSMTTRRPAGGALRVISTKTVTPTATTTSEEMLRGNKTYCTRQCNRSPSSMRAFRCSRSSCSCGRYDANADILFRTSISEPSQSVNHISNLPSALPRCATSIFIQGVITARAPALRRKSPATMFRPPFENLRFMYHRVRQIRDLGSPQLPNGKTLSSRTCNAYTQHRPTPQP